MRRSIVRLVLVTVVFAQAGWPAAEDRTESNRDPLRRPGSSVSRTAAGRRPSPLYLFVDVPSTIVCQAPSLPNISHLNV